MDEKLNLQTLVGQWLRWSIQNISSKWGLRVLRRFPKYLTEFETTIAYRDVLIRLFTGESIGYHLYYIGTLEKGLEDIFISLVNPGDLIYDVGANLGVYSLLAASQGGRVVAIEPSRKVSTFLQHNIVINNFTEQICWVDKAISDTEGITDFYETRDGNWGVGRIFAKNNNSDRYEVSSDSLDNVAATYGCPTLIKIDIEGAEFLALKGAMRMLSEKDSPIFIIEFHKVELAHIGGSIEQCDEIFEKNGFMKYQVSSQGLRKSHSWGVYSKNELPQNAELNRIR